MRSPSLHSMCANPSTLHMFVYSCCHLKAHVCACIQAAHVCMQVRKRGCLCPREHSGCWQGNAEGDGNRVQERLKTMSPEAKEKYLLKQKRIQDKRQSRIKMIRM